MTPALASFALISNGDDYCLRLVLEDGSDFELVATFDQLDDLAEEIDRRLDADED